MKLSFPVVLTGPSRSGGGRCGFGLLFELSSRAFVAQSLTPDACKVQRLYRSLYKSFRGKLGGVGAKYDLRPRRISHRASPEGIKIIAGGKRGPRAKGERRARNPRNRTTKISDP